MHSDIESFWEQAKQLQKQTAAIVVEEYGLPASTAIHDVVASTRVIEATCSWHEWSLAEKLNHKPLTPLLRDNSRNDMGMYGGPYGSWP